MLLKAKKTFKQSLRKLDLFSHLPTFRFNEEPQYQSLTGGVVSIILICVFFGVFLHIVQDTFSKSIIKSDYVVSQVQDPQYYSTNLKKQFMFTIGIQNVNLNSGTRYFDIVMQEREYNTTGRYSTTFPLYQCNLTDWAQQSFSNDFKSLNLTGWYCPISDSTMRFQGKFTSPSFKFYKISVRKCNPSLDLSRPCIDDATINNYVQANGGYKLNFYFVSPLLNPGEKQYISNYVRDGNYFLFSPTSGISANLYLSHYYVQSDNSLLPYQDINLDQGGIVIGQIQNFKFDVRKNEYVRLYLRKASVRIDIHRSFQKVDQTLAYIGGLFSSILTMLMLVSMYNQLCYQLQITKNVYHPSKSTPVDSDSFNFITFLGYLIYSSLQKINIQLPWEKMRTYHFYLESVKKQIDIRLILKKFVYFQRVTQALLSTKQIKALHMQQPQDLSEAEQVRKDIKLLNQLKKSKHIPEQIRQNIKENLQTEQYLSELKKSQSIISFTRRLNKVHPMIISPNQDSNQKKQNQKLQEQKIQSEVKKQNQKQRQKNDKSDQSADFNKKDKNLKDVGENNVQGDQFQSQYKQTFESMKSYMQNLYDACLKGNKVAIKIMKEIDKEIKNIFLAENNQKIYQSERQLQQSKNE